MKNVRMCKTVYYGPTDSRDSRVRATHLTTKKSVTVPWDHALDAHENHEAAATALLGRAPVFYTSVDGGGYIFGVDPRNDAKGE
jgi:hypothetical protein